MVLTPLINTDHAWHEEQSADDVDSAYLPAVQETQGLLLLSINDLLEPAAHAMQLGDPISVWKNPTGQSVHKLEAEAEYCPVAHLRTGKRFNQLILIKGLKVGRYQSIRQCYTRVTGARTYNEHAEDSVNRLVPANFPA